MPTCQICARDIKLTKHNTLYSHGYKIPMYGYRSNECEGSRYVPYEVSNARLREVIVMRRAYIEHLKETIARYVISPPDEIKTEDFRGRSVTYTRPTDFNSRAKHSTTTYHSYASQYDIQTIRFRWELRMADVSLAWMQQRYENWNKQDPKTLSIVGFCIDGVVRCDSCITGLQHDTKMLEAVKTGIVPVDLMSARGIPILPVLTLQGASLECYRCHCKLAPSENFDETSQMEINPVEDEMSWKDIEAEIKGAF